MNTILNIVGQMLVIAACATVALCVSASLLRENLWDYHLCRWLIVGGGLGGCALLVLAWIGGAR